MQDKWTTFIDDVLESYTATITETNTDDEVLYLMMGTMGKIASAFSKQDYENPQIREHCVAIAAAAMATHCIS